MLIAFESPSKRHPREHQYLVRQPEIYATMDSPAMLTSSEDSVSGPDTVTMVVSTLTGLLVLIVSFGIWAACRGPYIHRPRNMDEEEGFRMDGQTNIDVASRVVEREVSHEGTVVGWHSGWLAWSLRWPCRPGVSPPRSMPQPVDGIESGHGDLDQWIQHIGGQFPTSSAQNPPLLSNGDLYEPNTSGDSDEGALPHPEDEATISGLGGHLAMGDNVDSTATEAADHAGQDLGGVVRTSEPTVPTEHAITVFSIQPGQQHVATKKPLPKPASR